MILGVDLSHFQSNVNFAALKASGRDFVVLKATEGIGYTDASFAAYRKAAHAAGLIVGIYHFGRDGAPTAEAAYFSGVIGALQPGEFLVLDQEVTHASGNVPWCTAWLDATRAHYGVAPFIYMNQGSATGVTSGDWSAVAKVYGLWLARYDQAPATQNAVAYWGVPAMKQYFDQAQVPGVPTSPPCDVDSFFGTTAQLLAYGKGGTDMPLTDADAQLVAQKVWSYMTSGGQVQAQDRLTGIDSLQLPNIAASVAAVGAKLGTAQAPTIDETKLAAALLADPASVDALGKAIAAHLKLASG